jgi:hypothetical protein
MGIGIIRDSKIIAFKDKLAKEPPFFLNNKNQ